MNEGLGLEHWDEMIDAHPVLSVEEELALYHEREKGGRRGEAALEKLILHNLRAVFERVRRMNSDATHAHDLMSAGVLGLRKAAIKWAPMEGRRFYHYAYLWIKEGVIKEAKKLWRDDISLDAPTSTDEGEFSADTVLGAKEDSHLHLSSDLMMTLTEREKIIVQARLVDISEESDEELSTKLGVKSESISKMIFGSISKLLHRAA